MSRFIGIVFAACLLAIWTSTTVPAANPDWPKSLSLAIAAKRFSALAHLRRLLRCTNSAGMEA
jgi:hypothetical protein